MTTQVCSTRLFFCNNSLVIKIVPDDFHVATKIPCHQVPHANQRSHHPSHTLMCGHFVLHIFELQFQHYSNLTQINVVKNLIFSLYCHDLLSGPSPSQFWIYTSLYDRNLSSGASPNHFKSILPCSQTRHLRHSC